MTTDWHYRRPELAASYLKEFEQRGARALTLFAERAIGKTAFLQNDLAPAAASQGHVPVYVDVWAVRDNAATGIADTLKGAAQYFQQQQTLKRDVVSVSLNLFGTGGGVDLAPRPEPGEPANTLSRINFWTDRLAQLAGGHKVLLMLDEVQELAIQRDGVNIASALRAGFQRNFGRFEPVFTGSSRDKLLQMFNTSRAPLFEFGDNIDFPKLDHRFTAFVAERFQADSGVKLDASHLGAAFDALGRKPGSLIGLVRSMLREKQYDLTAVLASTLQREREQNDRVLSMAKLGPLDRVVLTHVAHERPVFAKDSLSYYAQQLGVEQVTVRAVQRSLERLRAEQMIYSAERGIYRMNDAAFGAALREQASDLASQANALERSKGIAEP